MSHNPLKAIDKELQTIMTKRKQPYATKANRIQICAVIDGRLLWRESENATR